MFLIYNHTAGSPFTVSGMGDKIILLPSKEHIKDISSAPEFHLSFHAFQNAVRSSVVNTNRHFEANNGNSIAFLS